MNVDAKKGYKDIDLPFTCLLTNRIFDFTTNFRKMYKNY